VGPNAADLSFSMFDLAGREVSVRSEKREDRITLDTRSLSSGTYLVRWSSVDGTSGSMPVVVAH
ncbi:MAG: T9SS type A sorting domain-containing protein, partial [Flavobacteriales bacterium]|nr:T9SS type A sorting domain-containing protein [Flavobacteriales bacterium]